MGSDSKIEWCHHTFNPWRGCTKVSDGCKFCYAETLSARNPAVLGGWGPKGLRSLASEGYWRQPFAWDKEAAAAGERHRVFCMSLGDVFEGDETMPAESRAPVWNARIRLFEVVMATANLDWLLLTKRTENVPIVLAKLLNHCSRAHPDHAFSRWLENWFVGQPPANVWVGTSIEDQKTADERVPHLLQIPAAVRFLSCEPMLGEIDLRKVRPMVAPINWVICGGESGPHARPMNPEWARSLRDQCVDAGVPFLFKQWGEWSPCATMREHSLARTRVSPDGTALYRIGKKAAGRLLDGREWNEYPAGEGQALSLHPEGSR